MKSDTNEGPVFGSGNICAVCVQKRSGLELSVL